MKPLRHRRALPIFYKLLLLLCLCTFVIAPSVLNRVKASADDKQAITPQSPAGLILISGTVTYYDPTSALADCAGNPAKPLSNVTVKTSEMPPLGTSNTGAPPSTGNYSIQ